MDAYRIGVHLSMANGVSSVLAVVSREMLGLNRTVDSTTASVGILRAALIGLGAVAVGGAMLAGIAAVVRGGEQLVHQQALLRAAGEDNRSIAEATGAAAAYDVFGLVYYASGLSASRFLARITKNTVSAFAAETSMYATDGYPTPSTTSPYPFAKDDYIQLVGFHNASAALYTYGSTTVGSYVTAKEIPAW